MTDATAQFDVFLSHDSADNSSVERLARRLREEADLNPFLDKWHLIPGKPRQEALEDALDTCATCAVFLGPSGIGPWHNEEMRLALDRRVNDRTRTFRVIPVFLPGADPADADTLPRFLGRMTWVDFRGGLDDAEAFRRLVAGIHGVAPGPGPLRQEAELTDEATPRPDASLTHSVPPIQCPATLDSTPAFTTLPVDLGTAWGAHRGSFVGLLVGWAGDGARETLLSTEGILWDARPPARPPLPARWWLRINLNQLPSGPRTPMDIWKSCIDRNDPLLVYIQKNGGRLPEQTILGLYSDIAVETEDISGVYKNRLSNWCHKITHPQLGLLEVALVVHITSSIPQRALSAAGCIQKQLTQNQLSVPLETLTLALWPGPMNLDVMVKDPLATDRFAPTPTYEKGYAVFNWIAKATAQNSKYLEEQVARYAVVIGVYQRLYGRFDIPDRLPAARYVIADIDTLETISTPGFDEAFLDLIETCLPGLTADLVRAYAKSKRPCAQQAAFEFATSRPDVVRSDALVDAWVQGTLACPDPRTVLQSLELAALPSGITLADKLLLGILRESRGGAIHPVLQANLDMTQPHLPSNVRPVFDLCTGALSEGDFLERYGAEEFATALRAGIDFKQLTAKLSAAGLTKPDLWWLLTALPLTPQRVEDLLAMNEPERSVAGLCTAAEWHRVQQDSTLATEVITCRRERPLHYLYTRNP